MLRHSQHLLTDSYSPYSHSCFSHTPHLTFLSTSTHASPPCHSPSLALPHPSQAMRPIAQAESKNADFSPLALFNLFVNRCKENLHVILAMSPIGDAFRNRLRKFPSLIDCCTIDWFQVSYALSGHSMPLFIPTRHCVYHMCVRIYVRMYVCTTLNAPVPLVSLRRGRKTPLRWWHRSSLRMWRCKRQRGPRWWLYASTFTSRQDIPQRGT